MEIEEFEFEEKTALCARAEELRKGGARILGVSFAREKWHLFFGASERLVISGDPGAIRLTEPRRPDPPLGAYKLQIGKYRHLSLEQIFRLPQEEGIDYLVWVRDESVRFDAGDKTMVTRFLNQKGG